MHRLVVGPPAYDDGFDPSLGAQEVGEGGAGRGAEAIVEHHDIFTVEGWGGGGVGQGLVPCDVYAQAVEEERGREVEAD